MKSVLLFVLAAGQPSACNHGSATAPDAGPDEGEDASQLDASALNDAGPTISYDVTCTSTTYPNGESVASGPCTHVRNLFLCEPTVAGSYPVAVWIGGTLSSYNDYGQTTGIEVEALHEMAARGYIAISPEYSGSISMLGKLPLWDANAQTNYLNKASCLFSPTPGSAVATACSWNDSATGAVGDCTKGIVVSGHSQGGTLAILSKNANPGIDAVMVYGSAPPLDNSYTAITLASAGRAIDDHHLRAATGYFDQFNGPGPDAGPDAGTVIAVNLNGLTGQTCSSATSATDNSCLREDGSGWVIPHPENLTPPNPAKHTFMSTTDCKAGDCPLDPLVWSSAATGPWSLPVSLTWLDQTRAQAH